MRLSELAPRWVTLAQWASPSPFYTGVSFLCPCCEHTPCPTCGHERGKRLAFQFWPPIDPDGLLGMVFELADNNGHRRIAGDTFDTLTIEPSVGFEQIGHWHGRITNGEMIG